MLKQLQKEMNLEMVEQLMSDSAEGIAYQKEVDLALQSKITAGEEEEVQEELERLLQEQVRPSLRLHEVRALIRCFEARCYAADCADHLATRSHHRTYGRTRFVLLPSSDSNPDSSQNPQRPKSRPARPKLVKRCSPDPFIPYSRTVLCLRTMQRILTFHHHTKRERELVRTILERLTTLLHRRCHSSSSTDDSDCKTKNSESANDLRTSEVR